MTIRIDSEPNHPRITPASKSNATSTSTDKDKPQYDPNKADSKKDSKEQDTPTRQYKDETVGTIVDTLA